MAPCDVQRQYLQAGAEQPSVQAMRNIVVVALTIFVGPSSYAQVQTPDEFLDAVKAVGEPPFDAARKMEPGYLEH